MGKIVITAAEVLQASSGRLVVAPDAIVTPLACDAAAENGIEIVRGGAGSQVPVLPAGSSAVGDDLSAKVRAIVTGLLGTGGGTLTGLTPQHSKPPVKLSRMREAKLAAFPYPGPPAGMEVTTADVVTGDDGSPIAAGYMTLTKGSFPWTFTYDEVQIVLEGELHLGGEAGGKVGYPGDIFYVPKGSEITFGTPSWTKFVYVTFPADWEGGL